MAEANHEIKDTRSQLNLLNQALSDAKSAASQLVCRSR